MGIIYKLTSSSNKSYIGQTKQTLIKRWNSHTSAARNHAGHCSALERAIRKYGDAGFTKEILVECDDAMLNLFEEKMIKAWGSNIRDIGYNLTSGGDAGQQFNDSTRLKMSEGQKKRHGNNLPRYLIKTGCQSAGKSGYQITNHPKCQRKRFSGEIKDDADSLKRALAYLEKLNKTDLIHTREELPKYISSTKSRAGYSVQIPRPDGNLRAQFASKKLSMDEKRSLAIKQLDKWKKEYDIE